MLCSSNKILEGGGDRCNNSSIVDRVVLGEGLSLPAFACSSLWLLFLSGLFFLVWFLQNAFAEFFLSSG